MSEHLHYVPVLKLKLGEIRALQEIYSDHDKITPIFEIPPIPWDYQNDMPAKSFNKHIEKVNENIKKCRGSYPCFLDMKHIESEIVASEEENKANIEAINTLFEEAYEDSLSYIPTLHLNFTEELRDILSEQIPKFNNGLCIRLDIEEFDTDDYTERLIDLIEYIDQPIEQTDIIIDFNTIPKVGIGPYVNGVKNIIRFLPYLSRWRSLIFIASSFPESMGEFTSNNISSTPRAEWSIWKKLTGDSPAKRLPVYGDYTITTPDPFEMDPRMIRLGAKIKYTLEEEWLIVKGTGVQKKGYEQFHTLAEMLSQHPNFYGKDFSWGDKYIEECGKKICKPGNQTTWVRVGVNHHIEVVMNQIAKLNET